MRQIFLVLITFITIWGCQSEEEKQKIEAEKQKIKEEKQKIEIVKQLNELNRNFISEILKKYDNDKIDSLLLINKEFFVPNSVAIFYAPKLNAMKSIKDEFQRKFDLIKDRLSLTDLSKLYDIEKGMLDNISSLENLRDKVDEANSIRKSMFLLYNNDKQLMILERNAKIIKTNF